MNPKISRFAAFSSALSLLPLLVMAFFSQACEAFECGYGGPGCSAPLMAGQCEDVLVVGQEYILIFGYGSDTGVSEAKVLSVESADPHMMLAAPTEGAPDVPYETGPTGPFDLNNGSNDGGITLRPLLPGKVDVIVGLEYWETNTKLTFRIVEEADAPEGFMPMTANERLSKCIEVTKSTGNP